jgi:hypothetical protein
MCGVQDTHCYISNLSNVQSIECYNPTEKETLQCPT